MFTKKSLTAQVNENKFFILTYFFKNHASVLLNTVKIPIQYYRTIKCICWNFRKVLLKIKNSDIK